MSTFFDPSKKVFASLRSSVGLNSTPSVRPLYLSPESSSHRQLSWLLPVRPVLATLSVLARSAGMAVHASVGALNRFSGGADEAGVDGAPAWPSAAGAFSL